MRLALPYSALKTKRKTIEGIPPIVEIPATVEIRAIAATRVTGAIRTIARGVR